MDRFKDFLQQHKEELDYSLPDQQTWNNIISKVKPATSGNRYRTILGWSAAAAVLIIAGISVLLVNRQPSQPVARNTVRQDTVVPQPSYQPIAETPAVAVTRQPAKPAAVAPAEQPVHTNGRDEAQALSALEDSYNKIFKARLASLSSIPLYPGSETCIADFKKQMLQINKDQQALEGRIRQEGLNEELLQHLIVIYQQKLTLLEQLQTIIKKMNNLGPSTDTTNIEGTRQISSLIRMI
jgi:hypothetical protein